MRRSAKAQCPHFLRAKACLSPLFPGVCVLSGWTMSGPLYLTVMLLLQQSNHVAERSCGNGLVLWLVELTCKFKLEIKEKRKWGETDRLRDWERDRHTDRQMRRETGRGLFQNYIFFLLLIHSGNDLLPVHLMLSFNLNEQRAVLSSHVWTVYFHVREFT